MFTVTLGWDASGNSKTCSPLGSEYSVMPSTDVIFCTPAGRVCAGAATAYTRRVRRANPCLQVILFTLDDSNSRRFRFPHVILNEMPLPTADQICRASQTVYEAMPPT